MYFILFLLYIFFIFNCCHLANKLYHRAMNVYLFIYIFYLFYSQNTFFGIYQLPICSFSRYYYLCYVDFLTDR